MAKLKQLEIEALVAEAEQMGAVFVEDIEKAYGLRRREITNSMKYAVDAGLLEFDAGGDKYVSPNVVKAAAHAPAEVIPPKVFNRLPEAWKPESHLKGDIEE